MSLVERLRTQEVDLFRLQEEAADTIESILAQIETLTKERDNLQQRIRDYSDITSGCPDVLVARTALTAALAAERERCAVIADKWMLMELARVIREMT